MVIGIDISAIPYHTGVSNYTLNLVRSLVKNDQTNIYKIFFSSRKLPFPQELNNLFDLPNVRIYHYHLPISLIELLWNRLRIFPIELFIGRCDVFHTSDWTQPPSLKAQLVTTVHDLAPFINPSWHDQKTISVHRRKMNLASKKCRAFICVSQNTKNDLLKYFPKIDPKKAHVVYEAAEPKYSQFKKLSRLQQNRKIRIFKSHYELDKFFLAQATREPRKNLDRLINAFEMFIQKYPQSGISLAVAGKYGWGKDIRLRRDHLKILGFVSEKDMVVLHASALCLVYPSLYEGFGLPLVKSMSVGVPIITSNLSSLPEVAGSSALLVDPYSEKELFKAMEAIFKSPELRRKLSRAGLSQSKKFSWYKTANSTLAIYQQLFSNLKN
jgi:glycosyltransferase involved in cell wall biosynthesis